MASFKYWFPGNFQPRGRPADTLPMSMEHGQDIFTFLLLSGLLLRVGLKRAPNRLHWILLSTMIFVLLWVAGDLLRLQKVGAGWDVAAIRLIFVGVTFASSLWLLLALETAQVRWWTRRRIPLLAFLLPPVVTVLTLLTNDAHHLFIRSSYSEAARTQIVLWAGPLCWLSVGWAATLVVVAAWFFLKDAWKRLGRGQVRRVAATVVACMLPLCAAVYWALNARTVQVDWTPMAYAISCLLLIFGVLRARLSHISPISTMDVIGNLRDGVIVASAEGEIVARNAAAEEILGDSVSWKPPRTLQEILSALGQSPASLLDVLREDYSGTTHTLGSTFDTEDGRCIEAGVTHVWRDPESLAGWFAILRDRTQVLRQQELLVQAQKLESIGVLSAGLAHEINNPLAYVRANLCYLQEFRTLFAKNLEYIAECNTDGLDELDQILEETLEGVERISKLVDRLRRFSRFPDENCGEVSLNEVVDSAITLADLHRPGKVRILCDLAPNLPPIRACEERLNQVVLNLLLNAKQALADRERGEIVVRTRCEGGWVDLVVSDNGPGFPEDLKQKIFEPFFTTKGPDEGTGLGLAIALDIVRKYGGVLDVRTSSEQGACFVMRFPITCPDSQPQPPIPK